MRPSLVAAFLASLLLGGCRTPATGPGAKGQTGSASMDECRDFMCTLDDGPLGPGSGVQLCHPTTCAKKRAWEERQRQKMVDAGAAPAVTKDAGTDADSDSTNIDGKCFEWSIDPDDGSLGLIPCRTKTDEEKLQEVRNEISARTGLQRF